MKYFEMSRLNVSKQVLSDDNSNSKNLKDCNVFDDKQ